MKRISSSLLITIIIALSSSLSTLYAQDSYKFPEAIIQEKNQITVGVFPQVELISIVQTISPYAKSFSFLMTKDSSSYKTDVINYFESYKMHPAILMFNRLSMQPRMLNFSAPSNIMLYINKYFDLRKDIKLDDFVINRAGGIDSLRLFLNLLKDFVIQSSFNAFFKEHRNFYSNLVENTIKNIGSTNYIAELENFYGKRQKSYNIILASLYNFVGYGNSLLCFDDQREIYNTMGPKMLLNKVPFFGDESYLKYMIRHEFSHPFINPLTEKYWDYVKDFSQKYKLIPEAARKNVCGDWHECIDEFTIRAITTQIGYNESNELGSQLNIKEKSRGVSYLDSLLDKIKFYQSNRKTYPTFESYYLDILNVFKTE
jgi:hypothetical protein